MRYPASEKLEIIRIVEGSHQSVKHTLEQIGVSRPTFYRWYDLYRRFGEAALEDRRGGSGRVWNRIPEDVRAQMLDMVFDACEALKENYLFPRDLSKKFPPDQKLALGVPLLPPVPQRRGFRMVSGMALLSGGDGVGP